MSKVVKKIGKGLKKVGKWLKKNWKIIVIVAAVVFTAGIATVGLPAFTASVASNGLFSTIGSTLWAGATSIAGTLGIGPGASGALAKAAGMQGANLFTGAWAGGSAALNPVTVTAAKKPIAGVTAANMSKVTGIGNVATAAQGAGGAATGNAAANLAASQITNQVAAPTFGTTIANAGNQAVQQAAGSNFWGSPLLGAAVQGAGAYFGQRANEEDEKPLAAWGYDIESGMLHMPGAQPRRPGDPIVPIQPPTG